MTELSDMDENGSLKAELPVSNKLHSNKAQLSAEFRVGRQHSPKRTYLNRQQRHQGGIRPSTKVVTDRRLDNPMI